MAIYFGQDIATKLALADAYYAAGNHINSHDWSQVTDDDKEAGLLQAEREVDVYLGISLEDSFSATDFPISGCPNKRPDIAVMEQARYILDETVRTKAGPDGAKKIESEEYQEEERDTGVGMAPIAQRFLGLNRVQISRG